MKIENVNSCKKVTEEIITIDEDFYNNDAIDDNNRYYSYIISYSFIDIN